MLVLFLLATLCGAVNPIERVKEQVLQAQQVSLLQRCLDGNPIVLLEENLPADGRANGDPCAADNQCASTHCVCQITGGKECQSNDVTNNVPECAPVDALLALDAYCWTPGSPLWRNLAPHPAWNAPVDADNQPSTDGRPDGGLVDRFGSFLFNGQAGVSVVQGLDISPSKYPQLSLEIWIKRRADANNREWVLGHDNGGYDRAINLHDDRYGGVAGPNGGTAASPLGYPQLGHWAHIVVTYGTNAKTYLNGQLWDEGAAHNGDGLPDFSIGGLTNFANHYVNALISQVRVYGRELSAADVTKRFQDTVTRYESNFVRLSRGPLDQTPYRIHGYASLATGTWYAHGSGNLINADNNLGNALTLYIYPATPTTENYLRFNQEYYIRTADGKYIERNARTTAETIYDEPHRSARFNLGLFDSPTQTWKVEHGDDGSTGYVPSSAVVYQSVAGQNSDWTARDNNVRRVVTIRWNDLQVVVWWYQTDERSAFQRI
jgi:hypothetical protein